jgi:hypothetical protein
MAVAGLYQQLQRALGMIGPMMGRPAYDRADDV